MIELTAGNRTGAYLLLASTPQAVPMAPAAEPRVQLILASKSGPDNALAHALSASLHAGGQHCMVAAGLNPRNWMRFSRRPAAATAS